MDENPKHSSVEEQEAPSQEQLEELKFIERAWKDPRCDKKALDKRRAKAH